MPITDLINDYCNELKSTSVSSHLAHSYSVFSQELIQSPNFAYSKDEMKKVTRFLLDGDFDQNVRSLIHERVARRKAMDGIDDIIVKTKIWNVLDQYYNNGQTEDSTRALSRAAEELGVPETLEYLEGMLRVYRHHFDAELKELEAERCEVQAGVIRKKGEVSDADDNIYPGLGFLRNVHCDYVNGTSIIVLRLENDILPFLRKKAKKD